MPVSVQALLNQLPKLSFFQGLPNWLMRNVRSPVGVAAIERASGGRSLRSLTGLDRKAAKQAFSSFLEGRQLTAVQNEFLDLTINYLAERGAIAPARFYESPFTEEQIIGILREQEAGARTADLARKHGVSEATRFVSRPLMPDGSGLRATSDGDER